ncbi:MAG: CCA tRNA nucleotidyltransferase [Holosporales bacterium]|jgi:tRNA nucleotidyltransferase/poly(A) polymerase
MAHLSLSSLFSPSVLGLLEALNTEGAQTRLVGGCVRDALLGIAPTDIDFATTLSPDTTLARLEKLSVKGIPTGLAHGTITAVLSNESVEITTLRTDITTNGRHAKVSFGTDWQADAARRDFTINALYADADGTVFDFFHGLEDLRRPGGTLVRFVGNAKARVEEDYLRILRFFRFAARFQPENLPLDQGAVAACQHGVLGLGRLSGERIQHEMKKFLALPHITRCLEVMTAIGLLAGLGLRQNNCSSLKSTEPMLRLACLSWDSDSAQLTARWKLSRADTKMLQRYHQAIATLGSNPTVQQSAAAVLADPHLPWANVEALHHAIYNTKSLPRVPYKPLPISASILLRNGVPEGEAIGVGLQRATKHWIDSVFTATPEILLRLAKGDD